MSPLRFRYSSQECHGTFSRLLKCPFFIADQWPRWWSDPFRGVQPLPLHVLDSSAAIAIRKRLRPFSRYVHCLYQSKWVTWNTDGTSLLTLCRVRIRATSQQTVRPLPPGGSHLDVKRGLRYGRLRFPKGPKWGRERDAARLQPQLHASVPCPFAQSGLGHLRQPALLLLD